MLAYLVLLCMPFYRLSASFLYLSFSHARLPPSRLHSSRPARPSQTLPRPSQALLRPCRGPPRPSHALPMRSLGCLRSFSFLSFPYVSSCRYHALAALVVMLAPRPWPCSFTCDCAMWSRCLIVGECLLRVVGLGLSGLWRKRAEAAAAIYSESYTRLAQFLTRWDQHAVTKRQP